MSDITASGLYGHRWSGVVVNLVQRMNQGRLLTSAAALAHYLMFAIFPGLIFLLGLLPYLPIPDLHKAIMHGLEDFLPSDTARLLSDTVAEVVTQKQGKLLSIGAVLALWGATSGISCLMEELNIANRVRETRSYLKRKMTALLLTLAFGTLVVVSFFLIVLGQQAHEWVMMHGAWVSIVVFFEVLRWMIIVGAILLALSAIYSFGPDTRNRHVWFTPGSCLAALLFILASLGFKLYVEYFANYQATYGSLGAVIVFMIWLNILGIVILLGSQIDSLISDYQKGRA